MLEGDPVEMPGPVGFIKFNALLFYELILQSSVPGESADGDGDAAGVAVELEVAVADPVDLRDDDVARLVLDPLQERLNPTLLERQNSLSNWLIANLF